ncbi:hypothetical protein GHH_c10070 [Geobacillus sp. GHH01]|nr:hypothetical protein GHH_c10070 [Geobacillus sp. GHH01]
MNGFLHAFILSYTKERGNAHSSPTYSLWSLKWESPARNRMKRIEPVPLLLAILAVAAIMAIGVFIAEQSLIGIAASTVILIAAMGAGFAHKKRTR